MLFRRKIPRSCSYCARGTQMDEEQVLCVKRGVVSVRHGCRKFRYDPCKRVPCKMRPLDFKKYDSEDFSL